MSNLPPGNYLVIALPDDLAGPWQTQAFLERAASLATAVIIKTDQNAALQALDFSMVKAILVAVAIAFVTTQQPARDARREASGTEFAGWSCNH